MGDPPYPQRKVDGKWRCRWCEKPLEGRRRSWCCEEHRKNGYLAFESSRAGNSYARGFLWQRDQGVCADCGLDARQLARVLNRLRRKARWPRGGASNETQRDFERRMFYRSRLSRIVRQLAERGFEGCLVRGFDGSFRIVKSLWEADHITPRILGGAHTMENLRTLCVPCHKAATRRLAKFRSRKKRLMLQPFV